jgi:hypothetical protein
VVDGLDVNQPDGLAEVAWVTDSVTVEQLGYRTHDPFADGFLPRCERICRSQVFPRRTNRGKVGGCCMKGWPRRRLHFLISTAT